MRMKFCSECSGGPWPLRRFYKKGQRADGSIRHDDICKACRIKDTAENRLLKPDWWREYDRRRAQTPEFKEQQKRYAQTPEGKAAIRRKTRAWRITHPEAYAAQKKRAAAALRAKRAAERSTPPRGTHDGYQDPRSADAGHRGASHLQDAG